MLETLNRSIVTWEEIQKARHRLDGIAFHTWVMRSRHFDLYSGCYAFFKMENMQRTGSLKFRGVFNFIKATLEQEHYSSVVTYSSGNHGQALALAATLLGMEATVVMPDNSPPGKISAVQEYGATVIHYDPNVQNPMQICESVSGKGSALFVPHGGAPLILAGEATAIVEFLDEIHDLDVLLIPAGGEDAIHWAVAAKHVAPNIRVHAAKFTSRPEPAKQHKSNEDHVTDIEVVLTESPDLEDHPLVESMLTVSEEELIDTQRFMLERMKVLTEPAGCCAAAALRFHKADFAGKRVGVVLTAGNADFLKLSVSLRREPLLAAGNHERVTYFVSCHSCKESFDALDTIWCNCLTSERTLVCPSCMNCFCKASRQYTESFWAHAPQALWDRKIMEQGERGLLNPNPRVWETRHPLVMVVYDSEQMQKMAIHMVRKLGFEAIHASNGEEGLTLAKQYQPEMILTDALMPKMDGREMCRRLKEDPETASIKVAVTTALYTQSKYRFEAFRAFHVDEYLSEPLSFRELQAVLQKHIPTSQY